jgi:hypothetical protein
MPSPFPGMNPYLERDIAWHDFHERFLILGAGIIGAQVRPNYVVKVDDHIFVHEVLVESRQPVGRADLGIVPTHQSVVPNPIGNLAVLEAPAHIRVPDGDVTREAFLEIRDRHSHEVVTVVELLSPSNKQRGGTDRAQYLAKRRQIFSSQVHFIEIDFLRGGEPMPGEGRPACCYSVLVSRAEERPLAGFWPIDLHDRLPVVPVPLRAPHPDATIDLQVLLDRVYDEAGYEFYIYDGAPHPHLNEAQEAWARTFVPRRS